MAVYARKKNGQDFVTLITAAYMLAMLAAKYCLINVVSINPERDVCFLLCTGIIAQRL